jgi:hypothetical protein
MRFSARSGEARTKISTNEWRTWSGTYRETHGHTNVSKHDDESLAEFCNKTKIARKHGTRKLTEERTARLVELGFKWRV